MAPESLKPKAPSVRRLRIWDSDLTKTTRPEARQ